MDGVVVGLPVGTIEGVNVKQSITFGELRKIFVGLMILSPYQ